jgi:hypothetical protein
MKRGLGLGLLPEAAEGLILDFVGRGEWFFVEQVSRRWCRRYLTHFAEVRSSRRCRSSARSGRSRRVTSYKSVLASVLRLELAISKGFDVERKDEQRCNSWLVAAAAGEYANKEVLVWLKSHHATLWGESVCGGAIRSGRMEMLQWLHEEQQCEWSSTAGSIAAQSNNLEMLKFIHSKNDGGTPSKNSYREDRIGLSLSALLSSNPEILDWCRKKRLFVDGVGHRDSKPVMYAASIAIESASVQPWLYKHGYRLPAGHKEYRAMVERHRNDPDSSSSSEYDSGASSGSGSGSAVYSSSSAYSSHSDEYLDHNSFVHEDDYFFM